MTFPERTTTDTSSVRGFRVRKSLNLIGLQSIVDIGLYDGTPAIRKKSGFGLEKTQLFELANSMEVYRELLKRNGVKVPVNYEVALDEKSISCVDELILGDTMDRKIKDGRYAQEWATLIRMLCGLRKDGPQSSVMLDAKPANWVSNRIGLYFIDMFPPPIRDANGLISPWVATLYKRSRLLFTFNYGDIRGQITKLLAGSKIEYPSQYENLAKIALREIKGQVPGEIEDYVVDQTRCSFPDMSCFYSDPEKGEVRLRSILKL